MILKQNSKPGIFIFANHFARNKIISLDSATILWVHLNGFLVPCGIIQDREKNAYRNYGFVIKYHVSTIYISSLAAALLERHTG